ncbi:MAG: YARHG domain-containing protein [Oscillospiraceae bacterium]|nr:YARHG domain-containing protein [Oscillospiraceae bacterium]
MWKCSACQNLNKDEYRFCLQCGEPKPANPAGKQKAAVRPAAKAKPVKTAPAKKKKVEDDDDDRNLSRTILLLLLALVFVVGVVAIIFYYPKLRGSLDDGDEGTETVSHHTGGDDRTEATEDPEGGSSIFIFGGETAAPVAETPAAVTPVPIPVPSELPAASEAVPTPTPASEPVPTPSAEPTPTPAPTAAFTGDYLIPDSDSRYLTEADLKDLSWQQCTLARNEIYARHGRKFLTKEIADYFNSKTWYKGTIEPAAFGESLLSEIERANVNFIMQYEIAHWGGSYY